MKEERLYKMHDRNDTSLYPSQLTILEIAKFVDKVCRKHEINYTLLLSSLIGAVRKKGFYKNVYWFQMGIMYEDMPRFKAAFTDASRETAYYLLDDTNFEQFELPFTLIKKRGTVKLPAERESEEVYYDQEIIIVPIFYAGDTKEEYKAFVKTAQKLKDCVDARDYNPKFGNLITRFKDRKDLRYRKKCLAERSGKDFQELKAHLTKYANYKTKFVYFLSPYSQDGCVREADTYKELTNLKFEGYPFLAIQKSSEWVHEVCKSRKNPEKGLENAEFVIYRAYGFHMLRQVQLIQTEMLAEIDRICRKHQIPYYINFGTLLGAVRHGGYIPWDDDADVVMMWEDFLKFRKVVEEDVDRDKFFFRTPYTDPHCNLAIATLRRKGTKQTFFSRDNIGTHIEIPLDIFPMFPGNELRIFEVIRDGLCRFFKTMLWTHLGAKEEKRVLRKLYYSILSKISNITAYEMFLKVGSMNKKKTNKLMFPYVLGLFYPHGEGVTDKDNYGEPVDLEFEGHKLMAPKKYIEVLTKTYGNECFGLPPYASRTPSHTCPEFIDLRGIEHNA